MIAIEEFKTKSHVMLDVEALGNSPTGVVTSIGAVQFCPVTGDIFDTFKVNIGIQSSMNKGMQVDGKTLMFWFTQPREAQAAMLQDPVPIEDALSQFRKWALALDGDDMFWWANGANYDFVILENSLEACKVSLPWKRNRLMDMRVIKHLTGYKAPNAYYEDNHHDSLADCERQVKMMKDMFDLLVS